MRYEAPLDPSCPIVREFRASLHDPMTDAMGAPVDEIEEDFARKHRLHCPRCQEYGLSNLEVV